MFRIGVLVSGAGTNLQAILNAVHGREGIEVVGVASNNADAAALEKAAQAGVETAIFGRDDFDDRSSRDLAIAQWLKKRDADLVVLAGYMELLSDQFLTAFPKRTINVHPSLLPEYPGLCAVQRQLADGVKVGGVTIHYVDQGVDTGPVILQESLRLPPSGDFGETVQSLHRLEHKLLPEAVRLFAAGKMEAN